MFLPHNIIRYTSTESGAIHVKRPSQHRGVVVMENRPFGSPSTILSLLVYIHIYIRGSLNKFPDFFVWALLLIVHTWNSSPLRSNLLRLQCTCCTVPTTSKRQHWSPFVRACQWPSSQSLSSPQLSHNDRLWA